jgi:type IV pilus assembly protein PilB
MAVRKRLSRSSAVGAAPTIEPPSAAPSGDDVARPVHPTNWLGGVLIEQGTITEEQLDAALAEQRESGRRLGEILITSGVIAESELARGLAEQLDLPVIDLRLRTPQVEALARLPEALVRSYRALPMAISDGDLYVAVDGPISDSALSELRAAAGMHVLLVISPSSDIDTVIDRSYSALHGLEQYTEAFGAEESFRVGPAARIEELDDNAPVVQVVQRILTEAVRQRASDIHIEPQDVKVRIRFRVDGALHDAADLPASIAQALVSRIKIMADMNIVERRRGQDGQFEATVDGNTLDVRVATTATIWGEKAVLRLLDKSKSLLELPRLGMRRETGEVFSKLIRSPFGMVICAGPTGSGKTTTLYAALSEINDPSRNITTIEDPVEYVLPSINQIQINEQADITFAGGLKSILRQDPDIILVGEIRDVETARIAVQSALTGHLVLSSLHATDSTAALYRFVDMGIETFLVASSVVGIVAQRLMRRICSACKEPYELPADDRAFYEGANPDSHKDVFFHGAGCNFCAQTGYSGRIGVYELLTVTEEIRELVVKQAPSDELRKVAIDQGLSTLRDEGFRLVDDDVTTVSEVLRTVYVG